MANILVTGGAGFIGSNFVDLCCQHNHNVVVLDLFTYAGHKENLSHLGKQIKIVQGDISDEKLVKTLLQEHSFDYVVNFAAESHVDRSISGPSPFIHTNIQGVFNMLRCSHAYYENLSGPKKKTFRFLNISTDEVYGELGDTGQFSETSPYKPNSPYSASKASGDMLVRAWHKTYGTPTLLTNCSNNYGPRQFPEKLIPFMIQRALQGKPLGIYGTGKNVRDWIHVEDHCKGVLLTLERGQPGETYCFGGDSERNNIEVVTTLCLLMDQLSPRNDGKSYQEQITFVADRPGHDHRYAIDSSFARRQLGFECTFNFTTGLESTVKWYLQNTDWIKSVTKESL